MKHPRAFSTLELMIAFAIAVLIVTAVVGVNFGAQYWVIASQTANEGLYKAKTRIEDLRAASRSNFYLATSSPAARDLSDAACQSGGLCYYVSSIITDLSPCSKLAHAVVDWQVPSYPTTTASLFTNLTSPGAIVSLGGDCILNQPSGTWTSASMNDASVGGVAGTPTALDVIDATAYIGSDATPHFQIADSSGIVASPYKNYVTPNAIDVARDESTGRLYAYVARDDSAGQLGIIDVTNSATAATTTYPFQLSGTTGTGWRIAFFARKVYIATQYVNPVSPELFVIDVSNPTSPVQLGSANIDTSIYDMVIRDQFYGGATHRLAYLVTSDTAKELRILDVTDPAHVTEITAGLTDLPPTTQPAESIFLSGTKVYVGFRSAGSGVHDLYELDGSTPFPTSGGLPILASVDTSPRNVTALRVSGEYLYMVGNSASDEVQVRDADDLSIIGTRGISGLGDTVLDIDGNTVYTVAGGTVHRITSP